MSENSSNYVLLAIVAIVAVVGLVVMFSGSKSVMMSGSEKEGSGKMMAGKGMSTPPTLPNELTNRTNV